jgi:hypothetical protein
MDENPGIVRLADSSGIMNHPRGPAGGEAGRVGGR